MHRLLVATLTLVAVTNAALAQTHLEETRKYVTDDFNKVLQLPADTVALDEKQKEAVQIAVRWNLYKITAPTNHSTPGALNKVVTDTEFLLSTVFRKDKEGYVVSKPVRSECALQVLEAVKDKILSNSNQPNITQINSARILSLTAELSGEEALLNYLGDLVAESERIDAVKYYAFKGIRGVLENLNKQQPPGIRDAATKKKLNTTLVKFIERKSPLLPKSPVEEIEGLRVLRREAIRALAETRDPGIVKEDPVALTLARAVSGEGLDPTTRLDERVEAAIGLMQLDPKQNNDYQLTAAAYHVASFLVFFAQEYAARKPMKEPWKIHAARLNDALQNWKGNTDPFVASVVRQGTILLKDYEEGRNPRIEDFAKVLNTKDSAGSIYKSDPKTEVKPGG